MRKITYDFRGYGITNIESKLHSYMEKDTRFATPLDIYKNDNVSNIIECIGMKAIFSIGTLDDDTGKFKDNDNCGLILYVPKTMMNLFEYTIEEHEQILQDELVIALKEALRYLNIHLTITEEEFVKKFAEKIHCQGIYNPKVPVKEYDHMVKTKSKMVICPKCKGSGLREERINLYESESVNCPYCKGHRVVYQKKTTTHTILS